jgi:hypothetical protein
VQALHNLAHEDNQLALQDNTVMKSIALLTMVFLPATFLSVCIATLIIFGAALTQLQAFFSTTFFTFGVNGWEASNRLWIYWVITVPTTIVVVIVWNIWLKYSRLRNFLRTWSWDAIVTEPTDSASVHQNV